MGTQEDPDEDVSSILIPSRNAYIGPQADLAHPAGPQEAEDLVRPEKGACGQHGPRGSAAILAPGIIGRGGGFFVARYGRENQFAAGALGERLSTPSSGSHRVYRSREQG